MPDGGERAPLPSSARERELAGRCATAVERGETDGIVSLLTDDAWLTMPPRPYEYQGAQAIDRFWHDRQTLRGAPFRLVPSRANGQPAFGCYLPDPQAAIARAYGLIVLTLTHDRISAITWFGERSLLARFGLPRTLLE
jgi:RNA polymerase sigma-70 factor (ECF subfamily)